MVTGAEGNEECVCECEAKGLMVVKGGLLGVIVSD